MFLVVLKQRRDGAALEPAALSLHACERREIVFKIIQGKMQLIHSGIVQTALIPATEAKLTEPRDFARFEKQTCVSC